MFLYYYLKNTAIYMDKNLVFQDEIENFFSRGERESLTFNLVVRDKIEGLKISSQEKMEPIITRIFEIKISRWALVPTILL